MNKINNFCFIVLIFCLFSACSNKTKEQPINLISNEKFESSDACSISYELWYKTLNLIPESKVIQLSSINKEEKGLEKKIKIFRDSLLNSVKAEMNKTDDDEKIILLREAVKNNDLNKYSKVAYYGFFNDKVFEQDGYRYSLYMGEKYNFAPAYNDVYIYLYKCSYILKRTFGDKDKLDDYLTYLNENLRNLALYCLIKSYNKGEIQNAPVLSNYFLDGIYFPKNIGISKSLDSIFENRPVIIIGDYPNPSVNVN